MTYTDDALTNHDTDNLKICHTGNPVGAASRMLTPAFRPGLLEERLEVTNGEEDITLETESGTGDDGMAKVPAEGGQGILLDHLLGGAQLLGGGVLVDL